jgi:zinc transporter ZupT
MYPGSFYMPLLDLCSAHKAAAAAAAVAQLGTMKQLFMTNADLGAHVAAAAAVQVAGIMTSVSFNELLPRALSYDRTGRVTYYGVMTGMLFMAVSLVLLALWD